MGRKTVGMRKGATRDELRTARTDVVIGMALSNLIMYFIIMTTAATLARRGVVGGAVGMISNVLSRGIERRADAFALGLTDAPEPFISFEQRITLRNVADPDPPAWQTLLLGSHPSTVQRIGMARAFQAGRR